MWESAEQRPIAFCDFERRAVAQQQRASSLLQIPIGSVDRLPNVREKPFSVALFLTVVVSAGDKRCFDGLLCIYNEFPSA
jgi:hypothetical protein